MTKYWNLALHADCYDAASVLCFVPRILELLAGVGAATHYHVGLANSLKAIKGDEWGRSLSLKKIKDGFSIYSLDSECDNTLGGWRFCISFQPLYGMLFVSAFEEFRLDDVVEVLAEPLGIRYGYVFCRDAKLGHLEFAMGVPVGIETPRNESLSLANWRNEISYGEKRHLRDMIRTPFGVSYVSPEHANRIAGLLPNAQGVYDLRPLGTQLCRLEIYQSNIFASACIGCIIA